MSTSRSCAATTALYRLAPPVVSSPRYTFFLKQGEKLDVDALRAQLALAGYSHVTQVVSPGEFSVRGGLIDLFPMGSRAALPARPVRRRDRDHPTFDADTQRTLYPVRDVRLLPAREFPLDEAGRTRFRGRFREVFEGDPSRSPLYKDIRQRHRAGRHRVLPAAVFRRDRDAVRLPAARCRSSRCTATCDAAVAALLAGHRIALPAAARRQGRPLLPPHAAVPAARRVPRRAESASRASSCLSRTPKAAVAPDAPIRRLPSVQVDRRADDPLAALEARRSRCSTAAC